MHDRIAKMLHKKRDLSDRERDAKMDVVKHMRDMASEAMGDKLDGLKKVSVASDSAEGLKHGLEKAKEIVSGSQEHDMLNDAEAPYSDVEHAHDEHKGEEGPNEFGQDEDSEDEKPFADGGMVGDSDGADQQASADEPDEDDEFHGLDMDDVNKKIQKLLKMRADLEAKKSE